MRHVDLPPGASIAWVNGRRSFDTRFSDDRAVPLLAPRGLTPVVPAAAGLLTLVCTFGGVLVGLMLRRLLPPDHLSEDSRDTIKLGVALVATMTALVLGLVTASAKSSFDAADTAVKHAAASVLSLDRVLARYGPETGATREALKVAVAHRVDAIWSPDPSRGIQRDPSSAAQGVEHLATQIRRLAPQTEEQRQLHARAVELGESLLDARWLVFGSLGPSVPVTFLVILLFWLSITFATFGLLAPPNATVVSVLFVCTLSVSTAVFLILEMDGPFDGVMTVSPEPLKYALAHLNR